MAEIVSFRFEDFIMLFESMMNNWNHSQIRFVATPIECLNVGTQFNEAHRLLSDIRHWNVLSGERFERQMLGISILIQQLEEKHSISSVKNVFTTHF